MNGWGEPPIKAARGIIVFVFHLVEGFVKPLGLLEDKLFDEYPIRWLIDLLDGGSSQCSWCGGSWTSSVPMGAERRTADEW